MLGSSHLDLNEHRACVLAKRSYAIRPGEPCRVADEQSVLRATPREWQARHQAPATQVGLDADTWCISKPGTDVVVHGTAYARGGPVRRLEVAVGIATRNGGFEFAERTRRRLVVIGERRVHRSFGGRLGFTEPTPFERVPLGFDLAYGGRDIWTAAQQPDHAAEQLQRLFGAEQGGDVTAYDYPRNTVGRGFVVVALSDSALEELSLPQIERYDDRLTPERLWAGSTERWHLAPRPGGFAWFDQDWFPRSAFTGVAPRFAGTPEDLPEVQARYLPGELAKTDLGRWVPWLAKDPEPKRNPHLNRFTHGATPWLALPTLTGTESIVLWGMHPHAAVWVIELPQVRPEMVVELPSGRVVQLEPALRTVEVHADAGRLDLVWAGTVATFEEYVFSAERADKARHAVRFQS